MEFYYREPVAPSCPCGIVRRFIDGRIERRSQKCKIHQRSGLRVDIVDKPAGLNNAAAYVGLVPAHRIGIVLLANRGDFPHEIARYRVLPELAAEE